MPPRLDPPRTPWHGEPVEEPPKPYRPVRISTDRGPLAARLYAPPRMGRVAMIWVGGVGGGWDTPARDLYPRLAEELVGAGVASLRVRFGDPTDLDTCTGDVIAAAAHLRGLGVERLGICGHSFGGAVAIRAAAAVPETRAVVTLATQAFGAEPASVLGPRCALLSLHGTADRVLSPDCSRHVQDIALEPKRLVLLPGAGHGLDEAAPQVHEEVRAWVLGHLPPSDA